MASGHRKACEAIFAVKRGNDGGAPIPVIRSNGSGAQLVRSALSGHPRRISAPPNPLKSGSSARFKIRHFCTKEARTAGHNVWQERTSRSVMNPLFGDMSEREL